MSSISLPVQDLLQKHRILYHTNSLPEKLHFTLDSLTALNNTEDEHFWHCTRRFLVKQLIKQYIPDNAFTLVDIGCGNGSLLRDIENSFPKAQLTGIDGYAEALINCRQRSSKVILQLQDITQLNCLQNQQYDVVTIMDVLEHLDNAQLVVGHLAELLKPNGIAIASVPASMKLWSDRDVFLGHRRRFTKEELAGLFKNAGLTPVHKNYLFSYMYLPVYLSRKVQVGATTKSGKRMEEDELRIVPVVNTFLKLLGYTEVMLSRHISLMVGTSAYCIFRKNA